MDHYPDFAAPDSHPPPQNPPTRPSLAPQPTAANVTSAPQRTAAPLHRQIWFWAVIAIALITVSLVLPQVIPPTSTPTIPVQPSVTGLANGEYVVGYGFPAGFYRAESDGTDWRCLISQIDDEGDWMDAADAMEGSAILRVVDVPGTIVSFSGCMNIVLATDRLRPDPASVTNGDWLVSLELPPGIYECLVDTDNPVFTRPWGGIALTLPNGSYQSNEANQGRILQIITSNSDTIASFWGCASIAQVTDPAPVSLEALTDGYWLIGDELPAGAYSCVVDMSYDDPVATIIWYDATGKMVDYLHAKEGTASATIPDLPGGIVSFKGCSTITRQ